MRQQMNLYSHSNKKNMNKTISSALAYIIIAFLVNPSALQAQQTKWMEVGALQNFYVDLGNEIEIARGLASRMVFAIQLFIRVWICKQPKVFGWGLEM